MAIILFSEKSDGNMGLNVDLDLNEARINRRVFLEKNGFKIENTFFMNCVHGTSINLINKVSGDGPVEMDDVDGFITFNPEVVLSFAPADCMPIVFSCVDDQGVTRGIALIHAGTRGIKHLIAKEATLKIYEAAKQRGINLQRLEVSFLNYIQSCCYDYYRFDLRTLGMIQVSTLFNSGSELRFSDLRWGLSIGNQECTCCTRGSDGGYKYFSHSRSCNSMNRVSAYPNVDLSPEGRNLVVVGF
ncbi:laccase domain-containing protein [Patescibacteria group bacterium]